MPYKLSSLFLSGQLPCENESTRQAAPGGGAFFGGALSRPKEDIVICPPLASGRSTRLGKNFGNVKVCFDSCLTMIAAAVALWAFGYLNGVGIGTVVSALAVGQLVKLWGWLYRRRQRNQ